MRRNPNPINTPRQNVCQKMGSFGQSCSLPSALLGHPIHPDNPCAIWLRFVIFLFGTPHDHRNPRPFCRFQSQIGFVSQKMFSGGGTPPAS